MSTKNWISARSRCGTLTSGTERCKASAVGYVRAHQEQTRLCGSICWGKTGVVKPVIHLRRSRLAGGPLDIKENK